MLSRNYALLKIFLSKPNEQLIIVYATYELKVKESTARGAGQMNLYLSIVDDLLRQPGDNPGIGLLLCKTNDKVIAGYALRDINKHIGTPWIYPWGGLVKTHKSYFVKEASMSEKTTEFREATDSWGLLTASMGVVLHETKDRF